METNYSIIIFYILTIYEFRVFPTTSHWSGLPGVGWTKERQRRVHVGSGRHKCRTCRYAPLSDLHALTRSPSLMDEGYRDTYR